MPMPMPMPIRPGLATVVRVVSLCGLVALASARGDELRPAQQQLQRQVMPLLKARCVKCHGPAKREGKLNLASPRGLARGGKQGAAVAAGRPDDSLLWARVADEEMPPDEPLAENEKAVLLRWIESGAPGLPKIAPGEPEAADHWAFAPLCRPAPPSVRDDSRLEGTIDRFLQSALEAEGLALGPAADRATLARRVCFDLTGLPPTPEEVARFVADSAPDAYERLVEHYLASPHYGERWGKYWLDAAGYADSNGYFAADTDRPLAYRYRDYVIRSWNADKPLDVFLREQLAGDELSGFRPGGPVTRETVDMLVATHFLRNSQDGTGESDGNPDELRADRYAVLEGTIEILGSALFGITFQCARCHDHKFEPITQQEYYQLQAILYPAYPAFTADRWRKPNERTLAAPLPADLAAWETRRRDLDAQIARLKAEFRTWAEQNRPRGTVRFQDGFDDAGGRLAPRWSNKAPGDDAPAGAVAVNVDSTAPPGAVIRQGTLAIVESGSEGSRWLSTAQAFDWTPEQPGGWVQASFDLVDVKADAAARPAERVGFYIALHDYDDDSPTAGGNILLDGNPAGGADVHVDYPGSDSRVAGTIGAAGYEPGHRYGVRITNEGQGKYRLEHLVDWAPESKSVVLTAADLPDGGFGFEFCCGRGFVVDNVVIEEGAGGTSGDAVAKWKSRRRQFDKQLRALESRRGTRPGAIAAVYDLAPEPPEVHLLKRGVYSNPGPAVEPGVPRVLCDPDNLYQVAPHATSTGRREALARWITRPGSRAAALLARVTANRIWQYHFGTGLVPTPENLGYSGTPPTNPELLEELAVQLVESGWSAKALHRAIVNSAAYRQSGSDEGAGRAVDPDNRLLWHFPLRRLDAEAVRDAMLAVSGELDDRIGGPYVPAAPASGGDVEVAESNPGARRRSVYLQQRRTFVVGMLAVFDAPSIVTNCTRRNTTTIPLQSLSLLNSAFVRARGRALAARIEREAGADPDARIARAFALIAGRRPTEEERAVARHFVATQPACYPDRKDAAEQAWADFGQALLASNPFLYVE
jgi:hypothetical protein